MPRYMTLRQDVGLPCGGQEVSESSVKEGQEWLQAYLTGHVQQIQEMKQHRVHPLQTDGTRTLLQHCRRVDDPSKCKGDFPRER